MKESKRDEILKTMVEIRKQVDEHIDTRVQERGNMTYYSDFEFKGSGLNYNVSDNVYIVEIDKKKERENVDNIEQNLTIYEIYDENKNLIATVTEDGKIHFAPEYIENLKDNYKEYFEQLNLDELDFKMPEELEEDDLMMTKEEIQKYEENNLNKDKEENPKGDKEKSIEEKEKEQKDQESEEAKKEEIAASLGIESSDVKSICTINPREKITDTYNLIDIMPEAEGYDEISIIHSSPNDKSNGRFTIVGISKDGKNQATTSTPLTSIEPVEGTSTGKDVISVNEDGTEVTEKQVQGLFRVNSRGRNDGISVSIGNYGMMDVDYVSNVMDKEHRRATPIRTKGPENVRVATSQVRENAGDSKEEVKKEGRIFRAKEEDGIDPQSLDGIDVDQADGGEMTLEQLKQYITEKTLDQGDMSKGETREFIESEIAESGLELSQGEIDYITKEIEERVLDEARFPTKGDRW